MTSFGYIFSFLEKLQHEWLQITSNNNKYIYILKHSWFIAIFSGFETDAKMKSVQWCIKVLGCKYE